MYLSCFFIIVAMLISNYITDHPNSEHQDQWQSCLSAIVTDYHKNLDPSKGDSLQLGREKSLFIHCILKIFIPKR